MTPAFPYQRRIVDGELDELLQGLPAIALEGAKAIGKTASASQRVASAHYLDDPEVRNVVEADPRRLLEGPLPTLIDEWQHVPESWDLVRRSVDTAGVRPGSYLLTGSASPKDPPSHSGAGRIVTVRMRPLTLAERGTETPSVSLSDLLTGERRALAGNTEVRLEDYVEEVLASGFPAIRTLSGRAHRAQLDSYLHRIVDRDFDEMGHAVRNPDGLRRWMTAYAAASSTTTSFEKIREAATSGDGHSPSRTAATPYRTTLERLWIVDPVPAWLPSRNHLRRLASPPKHQLVDPALAARLLGVNAGALLSSQSVGPRIARDGTLLGALFESLVTLNVRVYAQAAEATTKHLRTASGDREIDLIVERDDGRVVAIEVKAARTIRDDHLRGLKWLRGQIGEDLLDAIIISTGDTAYRREDGIGVVPAALLGP